MRYQYKCKKCGKYFEMVISINSVATTEIKCPDCNSSEVSRQWNTPALKFNGTGFYQTDNKKGPNE